MQIKEEGLVSGLRLLRFLLMCKKKDWVGGILPDCRKDLADMRGQDVVPWVTTTSTVGQIIP